jgi:BMFP domain-containing protein YqiC
MQTRSRLLDDLARVANSAAGVATGMREEIEAVVQQRVERILARMNLVTRDEFEVVKAMVAKARSEQEALEKRTSDLESRPRENNE